jgi:RNA polymerase sigma-70 factor, ECF subfamily
MREKTEPTSLEERFQQGDDGALTEMYRRYSAPMFSAAYQLLGNRELAAEAVQQAFVQAWRSASRFDTSRQLAPWLYAIVRRAALDVWRKERRHDNTVAIDDGAAAHTAVPGPSMEQAWQVWQVRSALDRLPPDERDVLKLAYFDGMTQTEVAEALGIALGTVKSRTMRAQRRLAGMLPHLRSEASESVG